MKKMSLPEGLKYWTADEVAMCLDYCEFLGEAAGDRLHNRLWQFQYDAKNPTPVGGDGTDGTVETPEERMELDNDDKASHWWGRLTVEEQAALIKAEAVLTVEEQAALIKAEAVAMAGRHQFHTEETQIPYGLFEVYYNSKPSETVVNETQADPFLENTPEIGWYWWECDDALKIADSDRRGRGPFATSQLAHEDADKWSPRYDY